MSQQQAEAPSDAVCKVCGGRKSEHFDDKGFPVTRHAFTELEGDLVTHREASKRSSGGREQPMMIRLPGATQNEGGAINKLLEIMIDRGTLTTAEALYICGIGPKPEQASGYQDPAMPPVSSGGIQGAQDC
jgi:hypothetical protein